MNKVQPVLASFAAYKHSKLSQQALIPQMSHSLLFHAFNSSGLQKHPSAQITSDFWTDNQAKHREVLWHGYCTWGLGRCMAKHGVCAPGHLLMADGEHQQTAAALGLTWGPQQWPQTVYKDVHGRGKIKGSSLFSRSNLLHFGNSDVIWRGYALHLDMYRHCGLAVAPESSQLPWALLQCQESVKVDKKQSSF